MKTLDSLLAAVKDHVMTPTEIWDQRVSFAYGQMMDCAPQSMLQPMAAESWHKPRPRGSRESLPGSVRSGAE